MNGNVPWRVVAVAAMPGYRVDVRFHDGTCGVLDMAALVESESAGVFASLRDQAVFDAVHIEFGAVAWPGEIDLAPDALHAVIKARGGCVLLPDGLFS
ncbi:DUF2442 domain-containing protein [Dyella sp. M7H15-1]|uniref:DUF2442 domain-containing protein n=1 Tax=Dyella sp. M7H15-1 TaxID=2501295 RepID=UPI00197AE080|nr:DUF2442 domain-containing protein [Dyella sp. M7H15-1]